MALDINVASIGGTATPAATGLPVNVTGGSVRIFSENDDGSLVGTPYLKSPETSLDFRLRTGRDSVLFTDAFNATTQNTNNWAYTFATLTAAQAGVGSVNFSAVQGTTSAHGAFMRTFQYFPLIGTSALSGEFTFGQFTAALVTNEVWLMGFGLPVNANTRPTDGVYVRLTTAGLEGVISFNNTEVSTGVIRAFSAFVLGNVDKIAIVVGEREVEYWMDDVLLAEQAIPVANGQPFLGKSVPLFMQKYNTGNVSNTNTMRVADVTVTLYDIDTVKPWAESQVTSGGHATVGQNGHTQGHNTANFAQLAVPTTAAGSNTAANAVGLCAYGVMTAQATNVATTHDNIAQAFQNPVPSINITGKNLVITGMWISCINTGAVVATTPTTLLWGVMYGGTAASLATLDTASFATATTHAPRRIPLGFMTCPVGAVVGATYDRDIVRSFNTPLVIHPGEFIGTTVHFRVGTATASQEVSYIVGYEGYWE